MEKKMSFNEVLPEIISCGKGSYEFRKVVETTKVPKRDDPNHPGLISRWIEKKNYRWVCVSAKKEQRDSLKLVLKAYKDFWNYCGKDTKKFKDFMSNCVFGYKYNQYKHVKPNLPEGAKPCNNILEDIGKYGWEFETQESDPSDRYCFL